MRRRMCFDTFYAPCVITHASLQCWPLMWICLAPLFQRTSSRAVAVRYRRCDASGSALCEHRSSRGSAQGKLTCLLTLKSLRYKLKGAIRSGIHGQHTLHGPCSKGSCPRVGRQVCPLSPAMVVEAASPSTSPHFCEPP